VVIDPTGLTPRRMSSCSGRTGKKIWSRDDEPDVEAVPLLPMWRLGEPACNRGLACRAPQSSRNGSTPLRRNCAGPVPPPSPRSTDDLAGHYTQFTPPSQELMETSADVMAPSLKRGRAVAIEAYERPGASCAPFAPTCEEAVGNGLGGMAAVHRSSAGRGR